jgi:hypothetical protein
LFLLDKNLFTDKSIIHPLPTDILTGQIVLGVLDRVLRDCHIFAKWMP